LLSFLVPFRLRHQILAVPELELLLSQILQSPYLGATDLDHGFEGTLGFSVLFQASEIERLLRILPAARAYLDKILDRSAQAFLVNPLVIHEGRGIGPHADKTLLSFLPPGTRLPFPHRVSVLYLAMPMGCQGGELIFHRNALVKARVKPRVNSLVEFPGWLYHQVTPWHQQGWDGRPSCPRVSLVCEQYRLSKQILQMLPRFHLESTRDFRAILEEASADLESLSL